MNKISQYLNEHILGEVITSLKTRQKFSNDSSILSLMPEMVVFPRNTSDLRKIARFAWQLAEKGHVMPLTIRGNGNDETGAAIGKGIVINTSKYLDNVLFVSAKPKSLFVHTQAGIEITKLNAVLQSQGMYLPSMPIDPSSTTTVGGSIANNNGGYLSGSLGLTGHWTTKLEVVLANGDIIETGRINKHEVSKKKGLQTFEGEIYRKIDGLIDDYQQTIANKITNNPTDNIGYQGIARVKSKDGSIDLTPLFVGSQGTLGFISEAVLRTTYYGTEDAALVATFSDFVEARDVADNLAKLSPASLMVIDDSYFEEAEKQGKKYVFSDDSRDVRPESILFISFNDVSDKTNRHNLKKAIKILQQTQGKVYSSEDYSIDELKIIRDVEVYYQETENKHESRPSIIDNVSIPLLRRGEFMNAMRELAAKHHVTLPISIEWLDGVVHTRPTLQLSTVSDKQKTFKLLSDYMSLVAKLGGSLSARGSEGRLRSKAAYAQLDDDEIELNEKIRQIFDPLGTLNPGVKSNLEIPALVAMLDSNK